MIVVMNHGNNASSIQQVVDFVEKAGLKTQVSKGVERTVIGLIGDKTKVDRSVLESIPDVAEIIDVSKPYKRAAREMHPDDTVITLNNGLKIGGKNEPVVMAGPCTVENWEMLSEIAEAVKSAGAKVLRGGAWKPRTSPYAFQGLGEEGLKLLDKARAATGLPVVSELMDTKDIPLFLKYVDIIQIGARNMQNFSLLKELGKINKPILLKRGLSATIEEWLMSAEYILAGGNTNVLLCERGIRTMEKYTRNTLDLSAVPVIKKMSHLPIIIDPSHAVGHWDYVPAMSKAAIVAGADGLIIEVHSAPEKAACDGGQCLKPKLFSGLMQDIKALSKYR
ncbi:3-deoxy-7-phosphoheptulonate synthase [Candidatus Termititenax persephonae]|uniref:3-deoxy-7-phosphoheptulonate synthase n=1 Tax=Candidatus Termititenax persephonae TaxID=2218525 RepID=A0A388THV3_9BACT|nr:3-deoxy-7-phosphoheptulonate synthase [Candidatus Termititenax persephonae]